MYMLLKGNQKLAQVLVEPGSFGLWQDLRNVIKYLRNYLQKVTIGINKTNKQKRLICLKLYLVQNNDYKMKMCNETS